MRYGRNASRLRPNDAAHSSRAPSVESEYPRPCPAVRGKSEDSREVAQPEHDDRCADGTPRQASTTLSPTEEALVVEFRRRTLLPLDDVLGNLRERIPKLTRSALHRCLLRHGISKRPAAADGAPKRGQFNDTTIGFVHIDHCELRAATGKVHMFLAIDRVSKFTYVEFHPSQR
jgi:hypothetical protein